MRAFNFRATDPERHQHAVQYIMLPDFDWPRLRKEFPEEFENPSELEDFYVRTAEFPAGFMTQYTPSMILGETARTDELTGLMNRLSLRLDLGVLRARIARHGQRHALLLADVDHFKAINDLYGHVAGDRVLQAVASTLSGSTRPEDGLYRYGGEEFALLVPLTSTSSALDIAERIRRAVEELASPNPANPPHGRLTISVGAVTIGKRELALDDEVWFRRADEALYQAKVAGRNRIMVWQPTSNSVPVASPKRALAGPRPG